MEKYQFVEQLKRRIKTWVIRTIKFCNTLPPETSTRVIKYQLVKSSSSTGANHRATSRSRSKKEFFAKISIALEEADESEYWLEIIEELNFRIDQNEQRWLLSEIREIIKILAKSRNTVRNY